MQDFGWYAVKESFKVYLKVNIDIAAKRAFYDKNRKATESFNSVEEQKQDMIVRFNLENERYFKLYGVHKEDMNNYDLIIDTSNLLPEQVADKIIEEYNIWINKK